MPDLPSSQPRWADTTPGNITEPTEPEKGTGYPAGNPRRQYTNWLFNTLYQWTSWFEQAFFRFFDFGPDQALPQGDTPSIGAGLSVLAADFSARVYADGFPVGLIASEAHTYPANSDTYWDLGRDAEWDANVVAAMAAAPALAANHVRVFMVRTNATDRTLLTDFRNTHVEFSTPLNLQSIRHGDSRLATAAAAAEERQATRYRGGNATGYTHVHTFIENGSPVNQVPTFLYIREATDELVAVRGARWNGTQWEDASNGSADRFSMLSLHAENMRPRQLLSAVVGTPFADSVWFASITSPTSGEKGLTIDGRLTLGNALATAYEANQVGCIRTVPVPAATTPYPLQTDFSSVVEYAPQRLGSTDGSTRAVNARYNQATNLWERQINGVDAYKVGLTPASGMIVWYRPAASANTWNDGEWTINCFFDRAAVRPEHLIPASIPFVPTAHALYRDLVPKAHGHIVTNGSGGFLFQDVAGCTVAFNGNAVQVTLLVNMATNYTVVASAHSLSHRVTALIVDENTFDLRAYPFDGTTEVNQQTVITRIDFVVFGTHA